MFMISKIKIPDYTRPIYQTVKTTYPMPDGRNEFERILGHESQVVYELSWATFDEKQELEESYVIAFSPNPEQIRAVMNGIYSDLASQLASFDLIIQDTDTFDEPD